VNESYTHLRLCAESRIPANTCGKQPDVVSNSAERLLFLVFLSFCQNLASAGVDEKLFVVLKLHFVDQIAF